MKKSIKKIIKYSAYKLVDFLFIFKSGRYFLEKINLNIGNKNYKIKYNNNVYKFLIQNRLNYYRARTFLTKEPITIEWIKKFKEGSIFWDVGANVGIYSCFASKERKTKTYAFEPSTLNLNTLSKNIFSNNLSKDIVIIPISLNNKTMIDSFNMSQLYEGGSQSTFSKNYGEDGKMLNLVFNYKTLSLTGNDLVKKFNFEKPNYIKIDVDGIEDLILNGFSEILEDTKSILIETSDIFNEKNNNIKIFLEKKGFNMEKKENSIIQKQVYNQIWNKK